MRNEAARTQQHSYNAAKLSSEPRGQTLRHDGIYRIIRGLPEGLWKEKIDEANYEHYTLLKSSNALTELFACLPSLLMHIEADVDPLHLPLVEAGPGDVSSEADTNLISDKPEFQCIRLPADREVNDAGDMTPEDVLIERTCNSIRISFRLTASHIALQSAMDVLLGVLHSHLRRTFTLRPFAPDDIPHVATHLKSAEGLPADVDFIAAWSDALSTEPPRVATRDWLAASLFRKRPVPGYNLSLLILPIHMSSSSPDEVVRAIWRILADLEQAARSAAEATFRRCNMVGVAYASKFEEEMKEAYIKIIEE